MSSSSNKGDKAPAPPNKSAVILLLGDIADTTWRMFIPTILLVVFGHWLDGELKTGPGLSIGGVIIGFVIAAWLIRKQLEKT